MVMLLRDFGPLILFMTYVIIHPWPTMYSTCTSIKGSIIIITSKLLQPQTRQYWDWTTLNCVIFLIKQS
jgi:hypothetical protein